MSRIVMKFGGTSMAGLERIRAAAVRVSAARAEGHEVAVVVSAMAGETDRLVGYCRDIASLHDQAEYDVVVASGEQVTSGLLALTLQAMGVPARSWQGWQLPVHTDDRHGAARMSAIETGPLREALGRGEVAVVPGFQGLSPAGRVTTLGRGGSDTSAVALAAALGANECRIYTDVEGVYTTDPRIVPRARKLTRITYEEMLELASVGAKVLHTRSVEMAMKHHVPLIVLSSFTDAEGTRVVDEEDIVENQVITGVAYSRNEAKLTVLEVPDRPGAVADVFAPIAEAGINVDMIVQNIAHDTGRTDVTFTVPASELERALAVLGEARAAAGHRRPAERQQRVQGERGRHRNAFARGRGDHDVPRFGRTRDQYPGDQHIRNQDQRPDRGGIYRGWRCRVLHTAYGLDAA